MLTSINWERRWETEYYSKTINRLHQQPWLRYNKGRSARIIRSYSTPRGSSRDEFHLGSQDGLNWLLNTLWRRDRWEEFLLLRQRVRYILRLVTNMIMNDLWSLWFNDAISMIYRIDESAQSLHYLSTVSLCANRREKEGIENRENRDGWLRYQG